jgi:hypothetical protein
MSLASLKTSPFFPSDPCPVQNESVVLAKSQKAFPGVKENETDRMEHNNHFEMRNSSETERVLKKLYLGDYNDFFKLEKK